jgi:hypothetical protein
LTKPTLPNSRKALVRFVRRFAARDAVADGFVEMVADFGVEFGFALLFLRNNFMLHAPVRLPVSPLDSEKF